MKKILLKTVSLLLSLLFVVMTLAACKKDEETVETTADTVSTETEGLTSKVPADLRFDGEEVNFVMPEGYQYDFCPEEGATGIIDEALRKVKLLTEERFGYKFNYVLDSGAVTGELQQNIQNSILAADGSFDLIANVSHASIGHVVQGYYYDLNKADDNNYVSTDYEWYNQEFVENVAYKGKLYGIVGDATISFTDRTPVMFYNEEALKNQQISEDLIQQVIDGKWTIEYMKTLIKDIWEDLDNSGEKSRGDFYGLFYNNGSMCNDAQLYAAGIRLTKKQADGTIAITWTEGKSVDAFKAVYDLVYETTGVYVGVSSKGTYYGETTNYYSEQAFFEKRSVFAYGMLSAAKVFALDPTLQYGILPLPKYSEDQSYSTTPQNGYLILAIPYNVAGRLQIATATLETMSEYSYKELRPVYYETAYKVRYASSENTGVLFDMIIDSMGIDFGSFYNTEMGKPVELLRNRLDGMNGVTIGSSLTGVTAQYNTVMKRSLQTLITSLEAINN